MDADLMDANLAHLHQKIDLLSSQVAYLTSQAEIQQRRQQEFDEFKSDIIPIANHMIKLTIEELAEIDPQFEVEDLFYLLKRVLRNIPLILAMMDRLESLMDLANEAEILGKQVFTTTVDRLDQMERAGYFAFARQGVRIIERIVTEFSEEDVQALGDNIVLILNTVRNMTQPEIMALANNAIGALQEPAPETKTLSTWALLRELADPKVRRGMARMINLLKALDEQNISRN